MKSLHVAIAAAAITAVGAAALATTNRPMTTVDVDNAPAWLVQAPQTEQSSLAPDPFAEGDFYPDRGPIYMQLEYIDDVATLEDAVTTHPVAVVAEVVSVSPGADNGHFVTQRLTLRVLDRIRGDAPQTLTIDRLWLDSQTRRPVIVEGQLDVTEGDKVLGFLKPQPGGTIDWRPDLLFRVDEDEIARTGRNIPLAPVLEGESLRDARDRIASARRSP